MTVESDKYYVHFKLVFGGDFFGISDVCFCQFVKWR